MRKSFLKPDADHMGLMGFSVSHIMTWIKEEDNMASVRKRATAPTSPVSKAKAVEVKAEPVKEEIKVVEPKKEEVKAEKKAPAKKASTAKKVSAKASKEVETAFYLQFQGREVSKELIEDRLKEVWTKDMGKDLSEIKKVTYYVKPEEAVVYFVVNDEVEGNFAI